MVKRNRPAFIDSAYSPDRYPATITGETESGKTITFISNIRSGRARFCYINQLTGARVYKVAGTKGCLFIEENNGPDHVHAWIKKNGINGGSYAK